MLRQAGRTPSSPHMPQACTQAGRQAPPTQQPARAPTWWSELDLSAGCSREYVSSPLEEEKPSAKGSLRGLLGPSPSAHCRRLLSPESEPERGRARPRLGLQAGAGAGRDGGRGEWGWGGCCHMRRVLKA